MGWAHRFKPPGGVGHGAANGAGVWGDATGTGSRAPFTAEHQPPEVHKEIGRMEAKEFREQLRSRLGKVLDSYDRAFESDNPDHGLKASDAITKRLFGDYKQTVENQADTRTDDEIMADIERRKRELGV
jgi:hypothetical protein